MALKIGVGIARHGCVKPDTEYAGLHLIAKFVSDPPEDMPSVCILSERSSILPATRHGIVRSAQKSGCSHIFMYDSDMAFNPDTLHRMWAHKKPFIAANCVTRKPPIRWTARRDGREITSLHKSGLEEVDRVGLAVALVSMDVFEKIEVPWFMFGFSKKLDDYVGEDNFFCERVKKAGFPIFIDHGISREVSHVGDFPYNADCFDPDVIEEAMS